MPHALSYPVTRFGLAGILSLVVTFLLFFLMQKLVVIQDVIVDDFDDGVLIVPFVRESIPELVTPRDRVKPPPQPETAPPIQEYEPFDKVSENVLPVTVPPTVPPIVSRTGPGFGVDTNADLVPIFKPQPAYPQRAQSSGIEGHVIVEYTVTAIGTTRDIRVVEADPPGIFNEVSITAASRFKYQPRVVGGEATEVTGVRNLFTFVLDN